MEIVKMTSAHIPALAELERQCFSTPWTQEGFREELDNPLALFLVGENECHEVQGYVGMHTVAGEGYITNVAVFPAYRRQGVARDLLSRLISAGEENRLSRITLEVRCGNTPAIALYEKMGFVKDGVRPGFYRHPTEDAGIYSFYFAD